jgi:phenylacetic acid degradation operon negative regulatory protein
LSKNAPQNGIGGPALTPKAVLINVFRLASWSTSVKAIDRVGELFGFGRSAVRVALTRLVRDGLASRDGRGWYTIGPAEDPIHRWIEEWRLGAERSRTWDGSWLVALPRSTLPRSARAKSVSALTRLGFRRGLPSLWLRPDNLHARRSQVVATLRALSLSPRFEVLEARGFSPDLEEQFGNELYDVSELLQRYDRAIPRLCASLERLHDLPPQRAMVESLMRGAEAVRLLTLDPLLPEALCPGGRRLELTELLGRYDRAGQDIWFRELNDPELVRPRAVEEEPPASPYADCAQAHTIAARDL